ncbi:MAG: MFS transporter [Methanomicrobiales archaeon]|nr:MFS transporter [Methanomicrobiales archaeon]
MRQRIPLLVAIFTVMALSNAIVPVLPAFAPGTALQGSIYAAYFFGALVTVLPAGLLSDRFGRVHFMQGGLVLTLLSGMLILALTSPMGVLAARFMEGIGAGLFVPAAMSWVNSQRDHEQLSGSFMALLNLGLLIGLFGTGWLASMMGDVRGGILLFTVLSLPPLLLSLLIEEGPRSQNGTVHVLQEGLRYIWLYLAALVLLGTTGVMSALYPEFSGGSPGLLSLEIGLMNLATIITVIVASRAHLQPVPTIRSAAILMAIAVIICYISPLGFALVGGLAGVIIIAQMAFLAETGMPQGAIMGLFNVSSYSGMTILPFVTGIVVQASGNNFLLAFMLTALLCLFVAATIGRCTCVLRIT